jgi:hypothetical protein
MMKIWVLGSALALCASPALADITAVYESGSFRMTVEIAANGDVRGEVAAKPGEYFISKGGETYIVLPTTLGVVVDRASDVMGVTVEVMEKMHPGFETQMKQVVATLKGHHSDRFQLMPGDQVSVRGRVGTPYFMKDMVGPGHAPVLVISHDRALEPLRVAVLRQSETSQELMRSSTGFDNPVSAATNEVLQTGAPLALGRAELTTVSDAPIPASRFELPGPLESRDQIRKRIEATATPDSVVGF